METLPSKTQELIKKMSTEYLVMKLTKADIDEETILKMSREQLMATWADLVAAGKDKPAGAGASKVVSPPAAAAAYYDPELEKQRLHFEMQKYEEEKAERLRLEAKSDANAERERLLREQEFSWQRSQAATASAWQKAQFDWQRATAEAEKTAQEQQFAWQREKEARERANRTSIAAQLKLFGDIVKNVAPKFPHDFADIPIFFESMEKLFDSVEVPVELRTKLLLPHLSERARSLLLRLDQKRQDNYVEMKAFLLNELQLTPFQFKSRFDNAKRLGDETWTLYCARLKNLLEYYCRSRTVGCDFDKLCSLLVADRVKAVLPQPCLNFILTAEATEPALAFTCDKIANMADVYHTTHTYDGKPRVAAGGENGNRSMSKTEYMGDNKGPVNNQVTNGNHVSSETRVKTPSSKPFSTGASNATSTNIRCFQCNQLGHTRKQCSSRVQGNSSYPARKVITSARVQAYSIDDIPNVSVTPVTSEFCIEKDQSRSTRDVIDSGDECTGGLNSVCMTPRTDRTAAGRPAANTSSTGGEAVGLESRDVLFSAATSNKRNNRCDRNTRIFYPSNIESNESQNVCSSAVMAESLQSPQSIADNIATLKYVKVAIDGIDHSLNALNDSGSQINLIRRSIIPENKMQTVGRIAIRGAFGDAIQTDVALLSIKPAVSDNNEVNIAPPVEVMFAICDELNERIILTSDTVNKLELLKQYNVLKIPDSVVAMTSVVDDEVDELSGSSDDDVIPLDGSTDYIASTVQDSSIDRMITTSSQPDMDSQMRSADYVTLRNEQITDPSLSKYWDMARDNQKNGFYVQDGLLYRHGQVNGEKVTQLCLPSQRISAVLKIAHDMPFGSHMAVRRTNDRIAMSFFFPGQRARVKDYCLRCETCQLFAPARRSDLNVIEPIPRDAPPFGHLVFDCIGPFSGSGRYKYGFVITDLNTRFPMAYALTNISAKKICDCLIEYFSIFSMPTVIHCDMGTNFTSNLTQLLLTRLGCAPRFNSSYHPQSSGLVERTNATLKTIISKLASSFPRSWESIVPFALWSLRTSVNETLGTSPYRAAFGRTPIGPLQILSDTWVGKRELPLDLAKHPSEYLKEVEEKLRIGQEYAEKHAVKAQKRYADYYNSKSSNKQFEVGEQVIYLTRNSNQKMFSHWLGPCLILRKKSPHSYVIDVDGVHRSVHVNHLRKFHPSISEVKVNNCSMIFDSDEDFGRIVSVENGPRVVDGRLNDDLNSSFGDKYKLVSHHPLPSSVIADEQLSHLSPSQRQELCELLDSYAECFSDKPGFCSYFEHHIEISKDFKPKRLREYRIPELLKAEVQRQIDELAADGFIVPSVSPMASPLVCVLKGKDGSGGVRLAVDYKYVNSFTQNDAYIMPNLDDLIHKIGSANFITTTDCRSGYWQLSVKPEDRWITAFAYDGGLWEWTRLPFGLRTSGNTFVRCVQMILNPVKDFSFSFVDDLSVGSHNWNHHMIHFRAFLTEIRKSGLTLNIKKCSFAKPEVKFIGHVIGSGRHRPDERKLDTIMDLSRPITKRDVKRMLGFFSYFRAYIPNAAELTHVLSNLITNDKPARVVWTETEDIAFQQLKQALCDCTRRNLYTIRYGEPFGVHVDSSKYAVGACLMQWNEDGTERPISFASSKLTGSQLSWAAVEKEAYAVVWALNKFRTWCFGVPIVIYSDSNPLTYLTSNATKSAKLTRWSLALQEYNYTFKFRRGTLNVVPDFLSRPCGEME